MKKLYLFVLASVMMLLSACHGSIWDAIDDLDARVARLEELCKEMNTNISSLQTIVSVLQENDYITGIVPIEKGGKVIGYTISFGKEIKPSFSILNSALPSGTLSKRTTAFFVACTVSTYEPDTKLTFTSPIALSSKSVIIT